MTDPALRKIADECRKVLAVKDWEYDDAPVLAQTVLNLLHEHEETCRVAGNELAHSGAFLARMAANLREIQQVRR